MDIVPNRVWVWRGEIAGRFAAAMACVLVAAVCSAEVLFPQPLHLTRRIEDPVSHTTSTVDEYCAGNQIVTISAARVAIVDYGRQQLTEIDRAAGTYSITPFEELAKASGDPAATKTADAKDWKTTPLGVKASRAGGRSVDAFELTLDNPSRGRMTIEVGIDAHVPLSRSAVEVLIGASYPNARRPEHEALLRAAAAPQRDRDAITKAAAETTYGLPVDQSITYVMGAESLTMRSSIVDVRSELAPPDLVTIPPGARQVESRAVRLAREQRELDH